MLLSILITFRFQFKDKIDKKHSSDSWMAYLGRRNESVKYKFGEWNYYSFKTKYIQLIEIRLFLGTVRYCLSAEHDLKNTPLEAFGSRVGWKPYVNIIEVLQNLFWNTNLFALNISETTAAIAVLSISLLAGNVRILMTMNYLVLSGTNDGWPQSTVRLRLLII